MSDEPFIRHLDDYDWERRPGRTDGVPWKLLINADRGGRPAGVGWRPRESKDQVLRVVG